MEEQILKAIDLVLSKFPDGVSALKYYFWYKCINEGFALIECLTIVLFLIFFLYLMIKIGKKFVDFANDVDTKENDKKFKLFEKTNEERLEMLLVRVLNDEQTMNEIINRLEILENNLKK